MFRDCAVLASILFWDSSWNVTETLTVANPQFTRLILSIDSIASRPSCMNVGSPVALYRYMALSISSVQHKHTQRGYFSFIHSYKSNNFTAKTKQILHYLKKKIIVMVPIWNVLPACPLFTKCLPRCYEGLLEHCESVSGCCGVLKGCVINGMSNSNSGAC